MFDSISVAQSTFILNHVTLRKFVYHFRQSNNFFFLFIMHPFEYEFLVFVSLYLTFMKLSCLLWILSQPHFEGIVRLPLTLLKMGLGSPLGFPKTQSAIAGLKKPCIGVFLVPLERFWSVDVQNGFAWAIWTSASQVMVKRRAGSQTAKSN